MTTPLPSRKATCNTIGGVLLAYGALMLAAVLITLLGTMGIQLIAGGLQSTPRSLEELLADPTVMASGSGYLVTCGLVVLMIRLWKGPGYLPGTFQKQGAMSLMSFGMILSVFLSIQLVSTLLGNMTESFLNHWGFSAQAALEMASGGSTTLTMFLYVSFGAPIVEELMFRGAILDSLKPYGKKFAMMTSALLFGLFHGNLIQIPFAFLVGLILAYVRTEYGLFWCIMLHFVNNCVFAELLSSWLSSQPNAMFHLLLTLGVLALVTLTLRGNQLRHQLKAMGPIEKGSWGDLFRSPLVLALLAYCLYSAFSTISLV